MSISQLWFTVHNWIFQQVNISFSVIKQQIINAVQQFKNNFLNFDFYMLLSYRTQSVFEVFIFTCIKAIKHNTQYLLEFKMTISQLWLCVHNWDFPQVNILYSVIKQHIINDVQQFLGSFSNLDCYLHWSCRTQYTVTLRL